MNQLIGSVNFLYQDQLNPIAQIDANGTVTRFIYGSRPHVPAYMTRGTERYRIVSDHLGSVRYVIDLETGEAVQENRYSRK